MTRMNVVWAGAEMADDGGLDCWGVGRRVLFDRFTVSANGGEWEVIVVETTCSSRIHWRAVDVRRYEQSTRVDEYAYSLRDRVAQ